MRSTEANCPMAQVRVFSSGFGSGETEEENQELLIGAFVNRHEQFKDSKAH